MQCPSCGTDVRVGQKFCAECGASLAALAGDPTRVMAGAPIGEHEATTGRVPTYPPPDQRESPTVQLPASAAATNQVKVVTTETTPVRFEDTEQVPFESRWDTPAIRRRRNRAAASSASGRSSCSPSSAPRPSSSAPSRR